MIYEFTVNHLPKVVKAYTVVRRTVWQMADPDHILLYIREGSCTVETGGRQYLLQQGDLLFLPENTMYIRRPVEESLCTMVYVHFSMPDIRIREAERVREEVWQRKQEMDNAFLQADVSGAESERLYLKAHMHLQEKQREIQRIMEDYGETKSGGTIHYHAEMSLLLLRGMLLASGTVLDELLATHIRLDRESAPANLRQAIAYIRKHEAEKISLTDLCAVCAVSKQMMMRYFRTNLHMTPTAYITSHKMNRAMEWMMRMPELSVKEIAWKVGYEDQCYFSRVFRKMTGETPVEYRKRVCGFDEGKHITEAQNKEEK